ncbi:hypothetical protein B0T24DRAFT_371336 [Lasiosphaeria ovina]|uniref:Secreted protein n=1 Tax=Lasiosphaeria ovina TaxID=92902 RepID=A0AAE0JYW2_9PEZI|nr:hypothetical protein B0T24DRAFT_371336 [Lasiosphaeria ovina]
MACFRSRLRFRLGMRVHCAVIIIIPSVADAKALPGLPQNAMQMRLFCHIPSLGEGCAELRGVKRGTAPPSPWRESLKHDAVNLIEYCCQLAHHRSSAPSNQCLALRKAIRSSTSKLQSSAPFPSGRLVQRRGTSDIEIAPKLNFDNSLGNGKPI